MALAVTSKKIDDVLYTFGMLPASSATEAWFSIEPFIANSGNALSATVAVGGKRMAAMNVASSDVPTQERDEIMATVAMLSALAALPEEAWTTPDGRRMNGRKRVVSLLLDHVSVGSQKVDIDVNFTGRLRALQQVLGEAMRFNFADFFSGLAAVIDSLPRARPSRGNAEVPSDNINWFLWRPTRCDPPLCTRHELDTTYSIGALRDFHEVLDIEEEYKRRFKAAAEAKAERDRGK